MRARQLVMALAVACATLACQGNHDVDDHQAAGERLARELPSLYPAQITAISFENSPPLDPPALFIDLAASMGPQEQLDFLCDEIWPRIRGTDEDISATVSYGWWDTDCPNP